MLVHDEGLLMLDELWTHQEAEASNFMKHWALFWEQGTGKTRTTCELAKRLLAQGQIDTVVVVVPNGLEKQWADEFKALGVQSHIANKNNKVDLFVFEMLEHMKNPVLITTYSFIATKPSRRSPLGGAERIVECFKNRKMLVVLDESAKIKSPRTLQSKAAREIGQHADYRRILDGTPVDTSPEDLYAQLMFLNRQVLIDYGVYSANAFRNTFFYTEKVYTGRSMWRQKAVKPRNLDLMRRMLADCSSRYRKSEIMDLPPKIFADMPFELSPQQKKDYDMLEEQLVLLCDTEDEDFKALVLAEQPIVLAIRLAQVACGFVRQEDGEFLEYKDNPRLELAVKRIRDANEQFVVWTRFVRDVDYLLDALGKDAVRYDGQIDATEKQESLLQFRHGAAKILVANTQALAFGHNLQFASNGLYYSYTGSLRLRRQSEDRLHRGGQLNSVLYTTLCGKDTIDELMLARHYERRETARQVMGDKDE